MGHSRRDFDWLSANCCSRSVMYRLHLSTKTEIGVVSANLCLETRADLRNPWSADVTASRVSNSVFIRSISLGADLISDMYSISFKVVRAMTSHAPIRPVTAPIGSTMLGRLSRLAD